MEQQFSAIMDNVEGFAEKIGTKLHVKISNIIIWCCFVGAILLFGFVTFSSKFFKSLFGIKE